MNTSWYRMILTDWLSADPYACSLSSSSRLDWTCPKQLSKIPGEIQGTQERPAEALKVLANAFKEVTCPTKGLCAEIFLSKKKKNYVEWHPIFERWSIIEVNEVFEV